MKTDSWMLTRRVLTGEGEEWRQGRESNGAPQRRDCSDRLIEYRLNLSPLF